MYPFSVIPLQGQEYNQIRQKYKIAIYKFIPAKDKDRVNDYIKDNYTNFFPINCSQIITLYRGMFRGIPALLESISQSLYKQEKNKAEIKLKYLIAILQEYNCTNVPMEIFFSSSKLDIIEIF